MFVRRKKYNELNTRFDKLRIEFNRVCEVTAKLAEENKSLSVDLKAEKYEHAYDLKNALYRAYIYDDNLVDKLELSVSDTFTYEELETLSKAEIFEKMLPLLFNRLAQNERFTSNINVQQVRTLKEGTLRYAATISLLMIK